MPNEEAPRQRRSLLSHYPNCSGYDESPSRLPAEFAKMISPPRTPATLPKSITLLAMHFLASAISVSAQDASQPASTQAAVTQPAVTQEEAKRHFRKSVVPFIKSYCIDCHQNSRPTEAGVNFSPAIHTPEHAAFSDQWKRAAARVAAHDMPPEGLDQPSDEERQMFVEWQKNIKYLSSKDPGPFVIRRLTKAEYANTLHDLFGVDPTIADSLPDEVSGAGYLNSLSPLQLEQYLAIAEKVLQQAHLTLYTHAASATSNSIEVQTSEPPIARLFSNYTEQQADLPVTFATQLLRVMYRRPASKEEIAVSLEVFKLGRGSDLSVEASLRLMVKAALVSPQFLFITPVELPATDEQAEDEQAEQETESTKIVPLDNYQLASRLSYFLWASMPDEQLMRLADEGRLQDKAILAKQTKRMLMSPNSRALFDGFGAQWLGLDDWGERTFDPELYPQMNQQLRQSMYDEARLLFESVVKENLTVRTLIDPDFTYLNGPLANIYDTDGPLGSQLQKVKLENPNRGGILAMPAVLAATSFPNRTSPVNRGVWVLEQVLGENVPAAPPDVPPLEEQPEAAAENLTMRQLTELHRQDPVCANCHKLLDPIGFGLENFDAIGRWRDFDATNTPINASGTLPDGTSFSGPAELKAMVTSRLEDFARNVTEKLLAYALCRTLEGYDAIVVDQIMQQVTEADYKLHAIVTQIATSYPFTHRRIP